MDIKEIRHTVKLTHVVSTGCEYCSEWLEGGNQAKAINHLLREHDGVLLHVGSEWAEDINGTPTFTTVAMIGMTEPPPPRKPVKVVIERSDADF